MGKRFNTDLENGRKSLTWSPCFHTRDARAFSLYAQVPAGLLLCCGSILSNEKRTQHGRAKGTITHPGRFRSNPRITRRIRHPSLIPTTLLNFSNVRIHKFPQENRTLLWAEFEQIPGDSKSAVLHHCRSKVCVVWLRGKEVLKLPQQTLHGRLAKITCSSHPFP